MSFILDDEFEDEIFFADEPDYETMDSLNVSHISEVNDKRSRFSSFNSLHINYTVQTTRASSFSSAPIAIDPSMSGKSNQNYEDELEFHMELKSLEMLSLIKGPVWAARLREKKEHLSSFDRVERALQRSMESGVETTFDSGDQEDYFLCSANDFDMSEDSGSQVNVRGTPRGFVVEQYQPSSSSFNREKAFSSATSREGEDDEDDDHEEEGDVFVMDL